MVYFKRRFRIFIRTGSVRVKLRAVVNVPLFPSQLYFVSFEIKFARGAFRNISVILLYVWKSWFLFICLVPRTADSSFVTIWIRS